MISAARLAGATTLSVGLVVAGLALAVWATGIVPEPGRAWIPVGAAVAIATGAIGNLLFAQALTDRTPRGAKRLLSAVMGDLFLHLIVGGGTLVTLFLIGTKFLAGATFGLAFAASAMVVRIASAGVMSRAVRIGAHHPSDSPVQPESTVQPDSSHSARSGRSD